ncbi:MAG: SMI1/KNR4 family protein [Reinekea sp.]
MKTINIFHDEGLVDVRLIADFEKKIGYVLPVSYKALISQHNALQPEDCNFKFFDKSLNRITSRDVTFLGYGPEISETSDISNLQWHDIYGREHLVVFGVTAGGDYICFDYSGNKAIEDPPVVIMFHDYFDSDGKMSVCFVSDNFNQFIDSLYSEE